MVDPAKLLKTYLSRVVFISLSGFILLLTDNVALVACLPCQNGLLEVSLCAYLFQDNKIIKFCIFFAPSLVNPLTSEFIYLVQLPNVPGQLIGLPQSNG